MISAFVQVLLLHKNPERYNGRVNIVEPPSPDIVFKMQEKIAIKNTSTAYCGAVAGTWESSLLSQLFFSAENIQIIATGDKKQPSITIFDKGEGQLPSEFENSFLSLHRNNKASINVDYHYNIFEGSNQTAHYPTLGVSRNESIFDFDSIGNFEYNPSQHQQLA